MLFNLNSFLHPLRLNYVFMGNRADGIKHDGRYCYARQLGNRLRQWNSTLLYVVGIG